MIRWRTFVAAITADVNRNPTWYAIVGYTTVSLIHTAIRAGLTERARVREVIAATTRDIETHADEIAERMTLARQSEHDATYDRAGWGEDDATVQHEAPTDG